MRDSNVKSTSINLKHMVSQNNDNMAGLRQVKDKVFVVSQINLSPWVIRRFVKARPHTHTQQSKPIPTERHERSQIHSLNLNTAIHNGVDMTPTMASFLFCKCSSGVPEVHPYHYNNPKHQ